VKQQPEPQETQTKDSTESASLAYSEGPILFDVGSLCAHLSRVKDGRKARGKRYPLVTLLVLLVLAKLCGQDTPEAMADWAQQHREALVHLLRLKRASMPHATTLGRVLRKAIVPEEFEREMQAYFARQPAVLRAQQVCLDGKQIRGTEAVAGEGNVYLLGAYLPGAGVMLLQAELAAGEGELSVAPRVVAALDLRGKVVSGDAAFTQRSLSAQIIQAHGDYVWKVKDNQPTLLADIQLLFQPPAPPLPGFNNPAPDFRTVREITCGHGRVETRTLTASSLLQGQSDWPGLAQVFKLTCHTLIKKTGQTTHSTTYGVTSLNTAQADPRTLLRLVVGHWGIEGGSHQRRDVTFHEDFCDLRHGHSAHIMAILNNIAISLIARAEGPNAAHARRSFAADLPRALALLTSG
jgi:predicted transposase YbfD/YdcC